MPAATQLTHLADFFNGIDWTRLRPAPELLAVQPGLITPGRYIAAACSDTRDLAVFYIPEDRQLQLNPAQIPTGLTARWVNPRSGEQLEVGPLSGPTLETPGPGDWLLLWH